MVKYDVSNPHPAMHKNRFISKLKNPTLKYGDMGFFFGREGRFELKYSFFLKKLIKTLKKKKKRKGKKRRKITTMRRRKLWVFLFPNMIVSYKSTNSRMGKGKGLINRWAIRVKGGSIFIEFKGVHLYKIFSIYKRLQQKLPIKIFLLNKWKPFLTTLKGSVSYRLYHRPKFIL